MEQDYPQNYIHTSESGKQYRLVGNEWIPVDNPLPEQTAAVKQSLAPVTTETPYGPYTTETSGLLDVMGAGLRKGLGEGTFWNDNSETRSMQNAQMQEAPDAMIMGQLAPTIAATPFMGPISSIPWGAGLAALSGENPLVGAAFGALPAAAYLGSKGLTMSQRLMGRAEIAAAHADFSTNLANMASRAVSKVDEETGMLVPRGSNQFTQGLNDAAPGVFGHAGRAAVNLDNIMGDIKAITGIADDVITPASLKSAKSANSTAFNQLSGDVDTLAINSKISKTNTMLHNAIAGSKDAEVIAYSAKLNQLRDEYARMIGVSRDQLNPLWQQRDAINALQRSMKNSDQMDMNVLSRASIYPQFTHLANKIRVGAPPQPARPGSLRSATAALAKKAATGSALAAGYNWIK